MNEFEKVLKFIDEHPEEYILLSLFSKLVGIKRTTLKYQILRKVIEGKLEKRIYYIHKDVARDIAIKNKVSILGWVRQKEIEKEFSISHQNLHYICKSRKLKSTKDYCGYVRFPPKTVLILRDIIPEYLSGKTMYRNGKLYCALTKLAHDMTLKIEKDQRIARFHKEEERIYKCLYSWCKRDLIEHIYTHGQISMYVPDHVYDRLVELIRIKDSAFLSDMSRKTIHNWIDRGILTTSKSPSGSTLISIKDLDDTLILKTQLQLMRGCIGIGNVNEMREIGEISSLTWNKKINELKSLGGDFSRSTKNWNTAAKDRHISNLEGWDKAKIRVVRAVGKRRHRSDLSLDKEKYSDEGSKTFGECLVDESTKSPIEELETQDILSLVDSLPKEDNEILCRLFGMSDYEAISMKQLSEEKNIPIVDLQKRVDNILVGLKEKLE